MSEQDLSKYRANVGVVLFHPDGRVWLGRRAATPPPFNWQFPQGGVDANEDYARAARRELKEETGVSSVAPLAAIDEWIPYDFPPGHGGSKAARGFLGQKQKWFAFRFDGADAEIDLSAHHEVEFDAWRWARLEEAADTVVPFKRDAYRRVIEAFAPLARRLSGGV